MTDSTALLEAVNLAVGYGDKVVVSDFNLSIQRGEVVCLLGPNGSGKSTILKTLAKLQPAVSGEIFLQGKRLQDYRNAELAKIVSLVLTERQRLPYMRVRELLAIARSPYTDFLGRLRAEDKEAIERAMVEVGIAEFSERFLDELSDGEKQKVFIAKALVQEPKLIILDEPTSHLDIRHMVEVIRILRKIAQTRQISCLMSLHELDLALKSSQYVLFLHEAKVAARGLPEDLLQEDLIQEFYELEGATYNQQLGILELEGPQRNDIFVWAGGNYGIELYRALSRQAYGLSSGILSPYDICYPVALGICHKIVERNPQEPSSAAGLQESLHLAKEAGVVVDSGYPGSLSAQFLEAVINEGITLFSLRSPKEIESIVSRDLYNDALNKQKLFFSASVSELLRFLM